MLEAADIDSTSGIMDIDATIICEKDSHKGNNGKILIERSLDELKTSITKIQIAFEDDMPSLPPEIQVLKKISTGRVHTLIVKGEPRAAEKAIGAMNPLLMDVLPLTLEEIFIYELGGADHAIKNIIL